LERLSSQVTLSLSLLILAAVALVIGLIVLIVRRTSESRPIASLKKKIQAASTLKALNELVRAFLSRELRMELANSTREEVKAHVRASNGNPAAQIQAIAILDEIDRLLYGGKEVTAHAISILREKFLGVIDEW